MCLSAGRVVRSISSTSEPERGIESCREHLRSLLLHDTCAVIPVTERAVILKVYYLSSSFHRSHAVFKYTSWYIYSYIAPAYYIPSQ